MAITGTIHNHTSIWEYPVPQTVSADFPERVTVFSVEVHDGLTDENSNPMIYFEWRIDVGGTMHAFTIGASDVDYPSDWEFYFEPPEIQAMLVEGDREIWNVVRDVCDHIYYAR